MCYYLLLIIYYERKFNYFPVIIMNARNELYTALYQAYRDKHI